jgi:hypothetical protein
VSARRSLITWSSGEVLTGAGGSGRDNALLGTDEVAEGTEPAKLDIPSWMVEEDVPKLGEALSLSVDLNLEFLIQSNCQL